MDFRIERSGVRQRVGGKEVLAGAEGARAVAHADFHLAPQDEDPLRLRRAVPFAFEPDRAMPQLVAPAGEHARERRLRRSFVERDWLFPKFRFSVFIGKQNHLREVHCVRYFSIAFACSAMPWPGRSGMRISPSLHSGSCSKRSGGAQSMNSTRKPFNKARPTWIEISWMRCGVREAPYAAPSLPIRSVSVKPFARQTSGIRYF